MKNKFVANIVMSEKFGSDAECDSFFNVIVLDESRLAKFDLGIFLTSDIKNVKNEMFLLNLVYENSEKELFHPLGTNVRFFSEAKKSTELIVFKDNEIDFKWDGMYTLEFRVCNEVRDINEMEIEELIAFIDESKMINSFSFVVETKK